MLAIEDPTACVANGTWSKQGVVSEGQPVFDSPPCLCCCSEPESRTWTRIHWPRHWLQWMDRHGRSLYFFLYEHEKAQYMRAQSEKEPPNDHRLQRLNSLRNNLQNNLQKPRTDWWHRRWFGCLGHWKRKHEDGNRFDVCCPGPMQKRGTGHARSLWLAERLIARGSIWQGSVAHFGCDGEGALTCQANPPARNPHQI